MANCISLRLPKSSVCPQDGGGGGRNESVGCYYELYKAPVLDGFKNMVHYWICHKLTTLSYTENLCILQPFFKTKKNEDINIYNSILSVLNTKLCSGPQPFWLHGLVAVGGRDGFVHTT